MKLTTTTQVSVDGVMQGNGGPDENRSGGFERGGWAPPLFDNEATTFLSEVYQRTDAFLFGRRTYEIFAGSWGTGSWGANQGNNPISVALNTRPKYVASTTLSDPQWADTTVLSGDVAVAIGELKAKPAGELQVHGSGSLVRWLFDNHNDLADHAFAAQLDAVGDAQRPRRLGRLAIDADAPLGNLVHRQAACLVEPRRPQPFVQPHVIHRCRS